MSKFEYEDFYESYGVVFNASKYTQEEAIEIFKEEFCDEDTVEEGFIDVYEIKIRWSPKMNSEELWYYDIDPKDNRGIYRVVEDEDIQNSNGKGIKCWRLRHYE